MLKKLCDSSWISLLLGVIVINVSASALWAVTCNNNGCRDWRCICWDDDGESGIMVNNTVPGRLALWGTTFPKDALGNTPTYIVKHIFCSCNLKCDNINSGLHQEDEPYCGGAPLCETNVGEWAWKCVYDAS